MTKLLEKAIAEVRKLPAQRQDEAAEILFSMVSQDRSDYALSPEQLADLEERLAGPADHATDAEVDAVFKRLLG